MSEVVAEQIDMVLSLGQLLKNARERAALSLEDVADHLRLKKEVIEKIEKDAFPEQELSVFVRGYIRAYARYVHVGKEEVEQYFHSIGIIEKPKTVGHAKFLIQKSLPSKRKPVKFITLAIALALIVLALLWVFWQRGDSMSSMLAMPTSVTNAKVTNSNPPAAPISTMGTVVSQDTTMSQPVVVATSSKK